MSEYGINNLPPFEEALMLINTFVNFDDEAEEEYAPGKSVMILGDKTPADMEDEDPFKIYVNPSEAPDRMLRAMQLWAELKNISHLEIPLVLPSSWVVETQHEF